MSHLIHVRPNRSASCADKLFCSGHSSSSHTPASPCCAGSRMLCIPAAQVGRPNQCMDEPRLLYQHLQENTLLQQHALEMAFSSHALQVTAACCACQGPPSRSCSAPAPMLCIQCQSLHIMDAVANHDLSLLEAYAIAYVPARLDLPRPGTVRDRTRAC
jgi:hypothetical protein